MTTEASPSRRRWQVGTLTYTTGGLVAVIFWLLLGDAGGLSIRDRAYPSAVQLLLKQLAISNTAMALLMTFLPQGIALLVGPIIGYRSDRFRSHWGRRIPFLLVATPIATVAMIGIAFCPQFAQGLHTLLAMRSPGTHACVLIVFTAFWICFQFAVVCGAAVLGGLFNDVIPRTVMGRFLAMFRAISLIDGIIYNYLIIGHVEAHFQAVFIGIAAVFCIGLLLMCFMVKEGEYPPPEEVASDSIRHGFISAAKLYFRECFTNRYYLWVFAGLTLSMLAPVPVATFGVWYAKSLKMDMTSYGYWIGTNHFCGLLLAYPLGMLVDRFHPLRMSIVTIALYAVTTLLGSFMIHGPRSFGVAMFAQAVVSGVFLTSSASLTQALLPRMKYSQFASAAAVLMSITTMVFTVVLGLMLDYNGNNYRLTFVAGFLLAVSAVVVLCVVYRKFIALGGVSKYTAPLT